MAKRKRDVPVLFWVSAEELELIHQKMQQYGTENLSAYLRKMALDGYVVKLELPELKELVSLMRRSSNNLNQLTRKVHVNFPLAPDAQVTVCDCMENFSGVENADMTRVQDGWSFTMKPYEIKTLRIVNEKK